MLRIKEKMQKDTELENSIVSDGSKSLLTDVRRRAGYLSGHISGSMNIDFSSISNARNVRNENETLLLVYCHTCILSHLYIVTAAPEAPLP